MAATSEVAPLPGVVAIPPAYTHLDYVSLPASAIWGGDRRLEAETYLTGGFGIRSQIQAVLPYDNLEDLATITLPSRLKAVIVPPDHGAPFLTATQVFDLRPVPRKWVALSKIRDPQQLYGKPGTILVTRSGSVGTPIVVFAPHLNGVIVSDDLLRVEPKDPKDLGYLYTFLKSRFGTTMLRSSKYGSVVKHLEPEHLLDVPTPQVPVKLRTSLNRRIAKVFRLREEAYLDTLKAEDLYADQFPAPGEPTGEDGFTVNTLRMAGGQRRLDGHYYNPVARQVVACLESSGKPLVTLSDVTTSVFGVPRFKHVYKPTGIPYVDSEDLFKLNPELDKFIPAVTKKDADKFYVESGWLLMACSGQLYGFNGTVVLANEWHENKIISNHVLRIVPKGIRPGYLMMALGHPTLGRPLVLRTAFGSEIPEIPPESLLDVPIPRLDVEDRIADLIEGANVKRLTATAIEEAAVSELEDHFDAALHGLAADTPQEPDRLNIDADPEDVLRALLAPRRTSNAQREREIAQREQEADEDYAEGRYKMFDNVDDFLADLDSAL